MHHNSTKLHSESSWAKFHPIFHLQDRSGEDVRLSLTWQRLAARSLLQTEDSALALSLQALAVLVYARETQVLADNPPLKRTCHSEKKSFASSHRYSD